MAERKKLTRKNKRMIILSVIAIILVAGMSIFLITHNSNGPTDENGNPAEKGEVAQDVLPGDEGSDSEADEADDAYSSEYDPAILYETAWSREENGIKEIFMFNELGDCFYGTIQGDAVEGEWGYAEFSPGQVIIEPYTTNGTIEKQGMHRLEIRNNNKSIKIDNIEYKLDDYGKWINFSME